MDAFPRELQPQTVDQQLGSPGFSFEIGWLAGIVLGTVLILSAVRRGTRRHGKATRRLDAAGS